ncbi:MAG TPA: NrfD/PsrC family molybdoenzyme membrane anchor subunit [Streptosporangiaceae bacterium]|jgi:polysulfide reductase-like protein
MSSSDATKDGLQGVRPGREATTGAGGTAQPARRWRRKNRAEAPMVPEARFDSYYGKPIINKPVWEGPDIPGYLFLGGLAGAGSVIAAGAQLTGRPGLARTMKCGSTVAAGLSLTALVHDLGRRTRFLNMLRTLKPTSPMSIGSWLLAGYAPATAAAAASDLTGIAPLAGAAATTAAAVTGPAVATYTAALIANTAVPAWHEGHRYLPFVFAASAASAAAGLGLAGAPLRENEPVLRLGMLAGVAELALEQVMEKRMGLPGEAYEEGRAKRYGRLAQAVTVAGVLTAGLAGRRSRMAAAAAGTALLAGSALTRFAIFQAGLNSADDPKYTVVPQRERLAGRTAARDTTPSLQ